MSFGFHFDRTGLTLCRLKGLHRLDNLPWRFGGRERLGLVFPWSGAEEGSLWVDLSLPVDKHSVDDILSMLRNTSCAYLRGWYLNVRGNTQPFTPPKSERRNHLCLIMDGYYFLIMYYEINTVNIHLSDGYA